MMRRTIVGWMVIAFAASELVLFVGCQKRSAVTAAQSNERIQRGQQAFLALCAMCHGPWGEGDGPLAADLKKQSGVSPAQLNDPARLEKLGRQEVIRVITEGGGRTHRSNLMPPWGERLPLAVIGEIADYVMALPSLKPGIPRITIERYLTAPPGTPDAGRKLFVYYCTMCHGPYGKGDGTLADTLWRNHQVRPRDLTDSLYFAKKTDQEMFVTVSLGGAYTGHSVFMPSWQPTLTPNQIMDLVSYVRAISRTASRR